MTQTTAPAAAPPPAPATPSPAAATAAQVEGGSGPASRTSRLRRLAAAVSSTHRAAVPF